MIHPKKSPKKYPFFLSSFFVLPSSFFFFGFFLVPNIFFFFFFTNFLLFISNISASTLEVVQDPYRTEVSYAQATLKNGVNIVIEKDPLLSSADLIFVVNAGSRHDGDHLGLAHLLEHMMFQGSKKYPKVNGFHDFIDRAAGRTNAFTEPEYTLYYMNMNVDDFPFFVFHVV